MSGKKGYIVRNQRNKNQLLFLTFILRTFDKNFAQLQLICPLVSGADEAVSVEENGKRVIICKKNGQVLMESNREMRLPYSTERIFNLIPGLQALRVQINPQAGWAEVGIRVESGEEDGL